MEEIGSFLEEICHQRISEADMIDFDYKGEIRWFDGANMLRERDSNEETHDNRVGFSLYHTDAMVVD